MKKVLLPLFLFYFFNSFSQVDSLKKVFHSNMPDSLKAEAFTKVCMFYTNNSPDTCLLYADTVFRFCETKQLKKYFPIILRLKGIANVNKGKYEESLKFYFAGLKYAEEQNNKKETASLFNNIGVNYWYQKNYLKARQYYLLSHDLRQVLGNKKELSKSFNNLGIISVELKEYEKALSYYKRSLDIKKEIKDEVGIANCYNNVGIVYEEIKKPEMALENYKQALGIFEKINDVRGKLVSLNNIAVIYKIKKEYPKAEFYAKQSLILAKEIDDKEDVKSSFDLLAASAYNQSKYKDAYEYLRAYCLIKDTLYSINTAEAMQEVEGKYQNEKKEQQLQIKDLRIGQQQQEINKSKIIKYALIIGLCLFIAISVLIYNRYLIKRKSHRIISQQKREVEEQKKIVEEKNHEIMDSIRYAKHIQEAILPHPHFVDSVLKNNFVLYKPKDIVSGDFYFVDETDACIYFAAVDCTGHGVPGAFISIVGSNGLSRCVKEFKISDPGKLLDKLNELVNETLRQKMHESRIRDGMDISLCVIDKKNKTLKYAGANNPLYYIRNGAFTEIKGDGQPIGTFVEEENHPFTTHSIKLQEGDTFYVFTDGFADQFGGPKGKKFKYKPFIALLSETAHLPLKEQSKKLEETFDNWKGNLEQIDDVCVIGVRV